MLRLFLFATLFALASARCTGGCGARGERGPRGPSGPCPTVTAVPEGSVCPAGGVSIQCPDGDAEFVCNGVSGNGTGSTVAPLTHVFFVDPNGPAVGADGSIAKPFRTLAAANAAALAVSPVSQDPVKLLISPGRWTVTSPFELVSNVHYINYGFLGLEIVAEHVVWDVGFGVNSGSSGGLETVLLEGITIQGDLTLNSTGNLGFIPGRLTLDNTVIIGTLYAFSALDKSPDSIFSEGQSSIFEVDLFGTTLTAHDLTIQNQLTVEAAEVTLWTSEIGGLTAYNTSFILLYSSNVYGETKLYFQAELTTYGGFLAFAELHDDSTLFPTNTPVSLTLADASFSFMKFGAVGGLVLQDDTTVVIESGMIETITMTGASFLELNNVVVSSQYELNNLAELHAANCAFEGEGILVANTTKMSAMSSAINSEFPRVSGLGRLDRSLTTFSIVVPAHAVKYDVVFSTKSQMDFLTPIYNVQLTQTTPLIATGNATLPVYYVNGKTTSQFSVFVPPSGYPIDVGFDVTIVLVT